MKFKNLLLVSLFAAESRHTLGTRLWANGNELLYNFQIGYQLGKFGAADIRACGGSVDVGYRFANLNGAPTIKLRSDFISGDDGIYRPDGSLSLGSSDSDSRYIGTAYVSTVSWQISKFLGYNAGLQYFKTGDFINDVIPQHMDGFFISSLLAFKF